MYQRDLGVPFVSFNTRTGHRSSAPEDCGRFVVTLPQGPVPVSGVFPAGVLLHLLETGIQAIQLSPYHTDHPTRRSRRLDTTAGFLACYFPRSPFRATGQPSDPETSPLVPARYASDTTLRLVAQLQHAPAAPVAPILVRDDKPRTRDRDDRGYRLPLVTTDLESAAEDLVARYASRWGIEQAFADARHIVGVGEARHRTRRAVERTVPFGLICFSVVTVWYALHGHAPDDVTSHRTRAAGTPRRPNRPTTTWPSSSAGSSSPRDFAVHAPSRPARKKPGPSSQPGPQPGHDQPKLRNTSHPVGARNRDTACDQGVHGQRTDLPVTAHRPVQHHFSPWSSDSRA
jgi:hypothetical protein